MFSVTLIGVQGPVLAPRAVPDCHASWPLLCSHTCCDNHLDWVWGIGVAYREALRFANQLTIASCLSRHDSGVLVDCARLLALHLVEWGCIESDWLDMLRGLERGCYGI